MTQCERILKYMDDFGSITAAEAMVDLGVMRLAARIFDIASRMGIEIIREKVKGFNRYGEPIVFMRYRRAE